MKWYHYIGVTVLLIGAVTLHGQARIIPESILIHSELSMESGLKLNLIVFTKEQDLIRASIHPADKSFGAVVAYDGQAVKMQEEIIDVYPTKVLEGEDAAGNLFDLIALNPEYHFRKWDGFDLESKVLQGFRIEIQREDDPIEETEIYKPISLKLFKVEASGDTLIRSTQYNQFFKNKEPYLQPKLLTFTDETTGEKGTIKVEKVEYNVGLPDFLFELPDNF